MNAAALLDQLCAHYHIAGDYQDIWGHRHSVSEDTRRRLLQAMHVAANSDEAMQQALEQAESAHWRRALPPVCVLTEGVDALRVAVGVTAEDHGHRHRWTLEHEDGTRRSAEFVPADLDLEGERRLEGVTWQRRRLELPERPAIGYHRLELQDLERTQAPVATMSLIVAPGQCYQPQAVRDRGRVWGPSLQLYALRSTRNWGIGDFSDLVRVLEVAAQTGAGLVGLNPLHALFLHDPEHASPYSPSSRLFLNVLYLDVEAVPDFSECEPVRQQVAGEPFQARLRALRATELVDYAGVAAAKLEVLENLYQHFRRAHREPGSSRAEAFERFRHEGGEALHRHALYEALQAWLHARDPAVWGWPVWPEAYRHPQGEAVVAFAAEQAERLEFYQYLQWQAQSQLEAAGRRAYELGLGLGIYQDVAVSVDVGGAEAWANQELYALEARIGSPPDDFNLEGQDWGLPPWNPESLWTRAYAPFIATLRANMRNAGVIRIDHVMALMRLFWVPPGQHPREGTYVSYPFQDLLGILALESQRNQCLVVGEDLGTVPDAVREALHPMAVLSYRLLYFEKAADGHFKPPGDFDAQTLVAVSTHDLPTLAGYWQGLDLDLRDRLKLFPDVPTREGQIIGRAEDRTRLLMALEREGLLPAGVGVQAVATPEMTPELAVAIHRYLARTPAMVMVAQMEDVLGQREQINLPATTDQHPNWRRKLSLDLEYWADEPRVLALFAALREERGQAAQPPGPEPPVERGLLRRAVIPRSTYRLQFHRDFTFDQGAAIVPYLAQLGISHCYASPCLQARPGSAHGYDITDHTNLNAELGGDAGFERLFGSLHEHGLGQIMDMVPNHMGVMGSDNVWWLDVLENGRASVYAAFFDIDWNPLKERLRNTVLIPLLGDHYGSVLEAGDLRLVLDAERGSLCVHYYEHVFPIDPREYPRVLGYDITRLEDRLEAGDSRLLEFQSLITAFGNLPPRVATDAARQREGVQERARDKEVHKSSLARLVQDADIARFLDENLHTFNSKSRIELFHELLEAQAWRLAYWRVASDETNYRRFFDITDLAGLRMENPEVFEATHQRILDLVARGRIQGLRIDHPDGLYDPAEYFRQLQERVAAHGAVPVETAGADPGRDAGAEAPRPLYLLVEKILAGHERLREDWAVHGTTGYDYANLVNGVFVDRAAEDMMTRTYRKVVDEELRAEDRVYAAKKLIMRASLASELSVLAQELSRIAELERYTRDFTLISLREALSEVVACFPVYRTYVDAAGAGPEDRRFVEWAVNVAKKRSTAADTLVYDFVQEVLLTDIAEGKAPAYRQRIVNFAMRFQQYTGPVMAKGLEDTAFYRYHRLVALNEVGGEPERFGVSVGRFHRANQERIERWPHSMLAGSTHDSKRGEDVRARIDVLSEVPEAWRAAVLRWVRINRGRKRRVDERPAPSPNDEYLLYQTLVGAWPLQTPDASGLEAFRDRIQAYMIKAVKEAKVHTSWINPNAEYEEAVSGFVAALLAEPERNAFLSHFLAFTQPLIRAGLCNGLAQALLRLTSPGVPDVYQGTELWHLSLVDPDNRRPVDYMHRQALLTALQAAWANAPGRIDLSRTLLEHLEDGRAKLHLTWRALQLRQQFPALFQDGDYRPLDASGRHAEHVCAFARGHEARHVVTVVPRLVYRLAEGADPVGERVWSDTAIEVPARHWENALTGEVLQAGENGRLAISDVLAHFPVALLVAAEKAPP